MAQSVDLRGRLGYNDEDLFKQRLEDRNCPIQQPAAVELQKSLILPHPQTFPPGQHDAGQVHAFHCLLSYHLRLTSR